MYLPGPVSIAGSACLLFSLGCGETELPTLAPVTGTVTYNGQPVANASVVFLPVEGRPASGITNEQGRFTLATFDTGDGAMLGEHVVTISPDADKIPEMPTGPNIPPPGTSTEGTSIPARYLSAQTTDLSAVVTADGENDFAFVLTD